MNVKLAGSPGGRVLRATRGLSPSHKSELPMPQQVRRRMDIGSLDKRRESL